MPFPPISAADCDADSLPLASTRSSPDTTFGRNAKSARWCSTARTPVANTTTYSSSIRAVPVQTASGIVATRTHRPASAPIIKGRRRYRSTSRPRGRVATRNGRN